MLLTPTTTFSLIKLIEEQKSCSFFHLPLTASWLGTNISSGPIYLAPKLYTRFSMWEANFQVHRKEKAQLHSCLFYSLCSRQETGMQKVLENWIALSSSSSTFLLSTNQASVFFYKTLLFVQKTDIIRFDQNHLLWIFFLVSFVFAVEYRARNLTQQWR